MSNDSFQEVETRPSCKYLPVALARGQRLRGSRGDYVLSESQQETGERSTYSVTGRKNAKPGKLDTKLLPVLLVAKMITCRVIFSTGIDLHLYWTKSLLTYRCSTSESPSFTSSAPREVNTK